MVWLFFLACPSTPCTPPTADSRPALKKPQLSQRPGECRAWHFVDIVGLSGRLRIRNRPRGVETSLTACGVQGLERSIRRKPQRGQKMLLNSAQGPPAALLPGSWSLAPWPHGGRRGVRRKSYSLRIQLPSWFGACLCWLGLGVQGSGLQHCQERRCYNAPFEKLSQLCWQWGLGLFVACFVRSVNSCQDPRNLT